LNFNDISDLQIISSNKIIDQVNFVKLKAEDAQVALNLLVLEHEKLPSVDHSMDLAEIKQLLNENDKLLLFMHKEMNN
jgi:predicted transcriptional regulator